jgi:hypothetical protein
LNYRGHKSDVALTRFLHRGSATNKLDSPLEILGKLTEGRGEQGEKQT